MCKWPTSLIIVLVPWPLSTWGIGTIFLFYFTLLVLGFSMASPLPVSHTHTTLWDRLTPFYRPVCFVCRYIFSPGHPDHLQSFFPFMLYPRYDSQSSHTQALNVFVKHFKSMQTFYLIWEEEDKHYPSILLCIYPPVFPCSIYWWVAMAQET